MVVRDAERLLKEDVESNEAIGSHGAAAILHGKEG
jgi:methylthioribose-1-phosphate isomerase